MDALDRAVDRFNREADRRFQESAARAWRLNVEHFLQRAIERGDEEEAQKLRAALEEEQA